jgi:hypothetical protein
MLIFWAKTFILRNKTQKFLSSNENDGVVIDEGNAMCKVVPSSAGFRSFPRAAFTLKMKTLLSFETSTLRDIPRHLNL